MRIWREWRERGALNASAARFVARLSAEPPPADVAWLAANATGGDVDHARWELRYMRCALGLLTSERDALDDRTASAVARELAGALAGDPAIARGKLQVAEAQLNARLRAYAAALDPSGDGSTGWRLGRALLDFAGRRDESNAGVVAGAGELAARHLAMANEILRQEFGGPGGDRLTEAAGRG